MKKRSKHTLSHYRLVTARMGELFPIACVPVLPGDTVQHHTSALVRCAPLNTPVMHPVRVRIHHFFVPNRLTWPVTEDGVGWENFITGGPDGNNSVTVPTVNTGTGGSKKPLLQYLGVPPTTQNFTVSALPLRAVNLIINEYYRDQDLQPERTLSDNSLPFCAWEKDYFTTCRPWTQKGSDVTIPISGEVIGTGQDSPQWEDEQGGPLGATFSDFGTGGDEFGLHVRQAGDPGIESVRFQANTPIGAQVISAGASVNDFREAFALQRYQEARARYGSRFTEYLRYLGITPSDARLQRPEYLGGGATRLNFSEVLQTTPSDSPDEAGVGDLYGHGIAGARTNRYRKFFEEHGYIISMMSVRPKTIYVNGVPREWLKRTKEDFYQRELVNLGQQPVSTREVAWDAEESVFGYQDRYDEYRTHWSQVSQDFRDLLSSWHLGRIIEGEGATLNAQFIQCRADDRIFQVEGVDNLWIMANHHIVARRLLPKRARPRIL